MRPFHRLTASYCDSGLPAFTGQRGEGAGTRPSPLFLLAAPHRREHRRSPRVPGETKFSRASKRDLSSSRSRTRVIFVRCASGTVMVPVPSPDESRCESGVCGGVGYGSSACYVVREETRAIAAAPGCCLCGRVTSTGSSARSSPTSTRRLGSPTRTPRSCTT